MTEMLRAPNGELYRAVAHDGGQVTVTLVCGLGTELTLTQGLIDDSAGWNTVRE